VALLRISLLVEQLNDFFMDIVAGRIKALTRG